MNTERILTRRRLVVGVAASAVGAVLAACGGESASVVPATAPARAPATAPIIGAVATGATITTGVAANMASAPVATAMVATGAATTGATVASGMALGASTAGSTIIVPAGLRTDLKGKTIKALLAADGPTRPWELAAAKKFEDATGIVVQVIAAPQSANERLAQILQQVGARSGDIDVYQIDGTWPGIFAEHAVDLMPIAKEVLPQHFERIVRNATLQGKLIEMPWFTDAGVLYYRTDLLKKYGYDQAPATWAELTTTAKKIQDGERAAGNPDLWGFVWQGAAYEGLTCDALEWQVSNGGGTIVEPDGKVTINNPQAIAAFERAKGWIGTITPPGVTTYKEEEARLVWQGGNAAFMRNWPYAYATGQAVDSKIKDKFDVTLLPKGDGATAVNAGTLGGWGLMVSKYGKNQDAATEFVRFLTSKEVQKSRAIERSNLPTISAVYDDADVLKANPFYARLKPVFLGGAVARPSTVTGELYNDVSVAYFTTVNQILTAQKDAKTAIPDLERQIQKIVK